MVKSFLKSVYESIEISDSLQKSLNYESKLDHNSSLLNR